MQLAQCAVEASADDAGLKLLAERVILQCTAEGCGMWEGSVDCRPGDACGSIAMHDAQISAHSNIFGKEAVHEQDLKTIKVPWPKASAKP